MRRWCALHCVFAKTGPSNRRDHAGASKIPAFDTLTVESGMYLVLVDRREPGSMGGSVEVCYALVAVTVFTGCHYYLEARDYARKSWLLVDGQDDSAKSARHLHIDTTTVETDPSSTCTPKS